MSKPLINPKLDFAIERFIDAPTRLVWEALTKPEHLKEWYMPKPWGRVSRAEIDVRPGGIIRIDIAVGDGQDSPNVGCILEAVPMERLVWTSMLFPGYRPAVFDDIPITAIITMETVGSGTRYVFTALHRNEAELETNKTSGLRGHRDRRRPVRRARARHEVVLRDSRGGRRGPSDAATPLRDRQSATISSTVISPATEPFQTRPQGIRDLAHSRSPRADLRNSCEKRPRRRWP